jgi:hypothetical protein
MYIKMIETFVESYLYEPANYLVEVPENLSSPNENLYITDYPTKLHPYNKGFEQSDPLITVRGVDEYANEIGHCCGYGEGDHIFLLNEGHQICIGCHNMNCGTCTILDNKRNNNNSEASSCLMCYGEIRSVDVDDTELTNIVTVHDMSRALAQVGQSVRSTDDEGEIEDLYEIMIARKQAIYNGVNLKEKILYPTQKSTYQSEMKKISEIKIKDGGFIWQKTI